MKLSEKIIYLRKKNGMSQEDLANELNVSRQTVSRWEVGSVLPDALNILNLSKLFDVTADYLLNDEYEEPFSLKAKMSARKKQCIIGGTLLGISFLWFSIIVIMSLIDPITCWINDRVYEGIIGYAIGNNIEWLFFMISVSALIGFICIFRPQVEKVLIKIKEYLASL